MARLTVTLPEPAGEALWRLAEEELRRPRDQAAKMLVDALRQHGALPSETTPAPHESGREAAQ